MQLKRIGGSSALQAAVVAVLGVSASLAARAQQAEPTPAAGHPAALETVVVTARRAEEALQDVPMTVDVTSGETLQQFNIFDTKGIQALVPGLEMTNTNGRSNAASLRGITFDPDQGTSPSVELYLNEIPVNAQTAFTAIYDLQQVEVLRGPQGALRGRTSPGGAITMTTRRPSLDLVEGYAQITGGEYSALNVQGAVSLPIIDGTLAVRLAGVTDQNDLNHVYSVNTGQRSRTHTNSGRISVEWKATESLDLRLMYQYLDGADRQLQQVIGDGNAPFGAFCFITGGAICDPTRSGPTSVKAKDYLGVVESEQRFENETHFVNLAFDWELGFATLSGNGAYQDTELTQYVTADPANAFPGWAGEGKNIVPYPIYTAELRLVSAPADFWNWSLDAFYNKQDGDVEARSRNDTFFLPAPEYLGLYLPIYTNTMVPVRSELWSLAASSGFQFTDQLRLDVALRYSDRVNEQKATAHVTSPGFPGFPPFGIPGIPSFDVLVPIVDGKTEENPLTGGVTLSYDISPDVMTYLAYAHSARDGTFGVGVPANISNDLVLAEPEEADALELGVKFYLRDRTLSLNADVFYQEFSQYLTRVYGIFYDNGARNAAGIPVGPPDGIVDDVFNFNYNGDATVKGAELSLFGPPVDNWDFSLSAAYAKARFDDATLPCNDFDGSGKPNTNGPPTIQGGGNVSYCNSDDRLGLLPDWSASFNTELRFPMDEFEYYARTLISYRPGFTSETTNYDYEDLTRVDLFAGVREDNWDLSLYVKNLLDENEVTNISAGNAVLATASGLPFDSGYRTVNVTRQLEFGAAVLYRF